MPNGTLFDEATIHILTTATLRRLESRYPRGRFEVQRFRPNVLLEVESSEEGFVEERWLGRTLKLGDEVVLRVTSSCLRCVMVNLRQEDLPKDPNVLRTIAQLNDGKAGVYATVLRGGHVFVNDEIVLD